MSKVDSRTATSAVDATFFDASKVVDDLEDDPDYGMQPHRDATCEKWVRSGEGRLLLQSSPAAAASGVLDIRAIVAASLARSANAGSDGNA